MEGTAEEELYWESELYHGYSEPSKHQHHQQHTHGIQAAHIKHGAQHMNLQDAHSKHGIRADPINQHQRFQSIDQRQNQRF